MNSDDAQRQAIDSYPVKRAISVRVSDLDGYGHMNAIRIGHFYEDARAAFYGEAFGEVERPRLLVAQLTMRYLREGFWPGSLHVASAISRIGTSSCEMVQALFDGEGHCLGLCETVLVNTGNGSSAPLREETRNCLERLRLRQPGESPGLPGQPRSRRADVQSGG